VTGGIDISRIDRQARTAGYRDGLLEIFAAAVLLTMAFGWVVNPGFVGILAAFIVLYGWKAVERVKERVTYPRTGYHRERADEPNGNARGMLLFMAGAFLLMVVAILVTGSITESSGWRRAAPLMSAISLAGGFWYTGNQSGLLRHRLIAAWSLLTGIVLWLIGSGESYSGVVWHLLSLATPLAVIGIWGLVCFLRTYPVRDVPTDE
jgi:hypothetical protein